METSYSRKCNLQIIRPNHILLHSLNQVCPKIKIQLAESYKEAMSTIKSRLTKRLMHKPLLRNEVIKIVMDTLRATDQYLDTIHPCVKLDDCIGTNYIMGTFRYINPFNQDTAAQEGRVNLCIIFENVKMMPGTTIYAEDMYVTITDLGVYYEPMYIDFFNGVSQLVGSRV